MLLDSFSKVRISWGDIELGTKGRLPPAWPPTRWAHADCSTLVDELEGEPVRISPWPESRCRSTATADRKTTRLRLSRASLLLPENHVQNDEDSCHHPSPDDRLLIPVIVMFFRQRRDAVDQVCQLCHRTRLGHITHQHRHKHAHQPRPHGAINILCHCLG